MLGTSGLEPRLLTRFDCRLYAREAYELGVRYVGGCCGFEPYHIREVAEEVSSLHVVFLLGVKIVLLSALPFKA